VAVVDTALTVESEPESEVLHAVVTSTIAAAKTRTLFIGMPGT
jgi:hypothetical protein